MALTTCWVNSGLWRGVSMLYGLVKTAGRIIRVAETSLGVLRKVEASFI
jgi:hypothetical protein